MVRVGLFSLGSTLIGWIVQKTGLLQFLELLHVTFLCHAFLQETARRQSSRGIRRRHFNLGEITVRLIPSIGIRLLLIAPVEGYLYRLAENSRVSGSPDDDGTRPFA